MNYLAHLYFSDPDPLAWAGSLMGDFVKGRLSSSLPQQLLTHLKLHRQIDSYTCRNDFFQESRRRIDPRFRHGRSVLVDVFYDHLLAAQWETYHALSLEEFSSQVYAGLYDVYDLLSPGLQQILPFMVERNWLLSYRQDPVVRRVLQRLQERINHRLPLAEAYSELGRLRGKLEADFACFMPQLADFVARQKSVSPE